VSKFGEKAKVRRSSVAGAPLRFDGEGWILGTAGPGRARGCYMGQGIYYGSVKYLTRYT
jgi:hypothetical protein